MMDSSNALSSSPLTQTEQAELDTRLLKAAQDGDTDTVSALISTGANVNTADQYGYTALMAGYSWPYYHCFRFNCCSR
jgi:ankyrin repeat protein